MGLRDLLPARERTLARATTALISAASFGLLGAGAAAAAPGYPVTSFGTGGAVESQFGLDSPATSAGGSVAVAGNGDIYVAGGADDKSGNSQLFVARYLPNGALDTTFNKTGVAYATVAGASQTAPTFGPFGGAIYLALTPSGDPVVLTGADLSGGGNEAAVVEFTTSGDLNPAFNSAGTQPGIEPIQVNGDATNPGGIAVQSNGAIVLTGSVRVSSNTEFFAERLNAYGSIDSGFGANGVEAEQLSPSGTYSSGTAVIAQSNGDLTFSVTADYSSGNSEFAIARLTASGQPDLSFNGSGVAYAQPSTYKTPSSTPMSLTQTADGGYALGGEANDANGSAVAAARFTGTGQLVTGFGSGGTFVLPTVAPTSPSTQAFNGATAVFSQPDGKLILSGPGGQLGFSLSAAQAVSPMVVRLNANGTVDSSFGSGGTVSGLQSYQLNLAWSAAETGDGNLVLTGASIPTLSSLNSSSFIQEVNLDAPPTIVATSSTASVQAGNPVQFTAAAVGADGQPVTQLSWDLGSGSFGDATGATATRTFTVPGVYTIRVKATDGFGLSSTTTQTVTVTPAPTPPAVTPAVKRSPQLKLVHVRAKNGKVKLTLLCAFATCRVNTRLITHARLISGKTSSLSASGSGKAVTVGGDRFTIGQNRTRTITIKLNRLGQRLLKAFSRIPTRATVKLTNTRPNRVIRRKITIG